MLYSHSISIREFTNMDREKIRPTKHALLFSQLPVQRSKSKYRKYQVIHTKFRKRTKLILGCLIVCGMLLIFCYRLIAKSKNRNHQNKRTVSKTEKERKVILTKSRDYIGMFAMFCVVNVIVINMYFSFP